VNPDFRKHSIRLPELKLKSQKKQKQKQKQKTLNSTSLEAHNFNEKHATLISKARYRWPIAFIEVEGIFERCFCCSKAAG